MFEERDRSRQDHQELPYSIGPCIEAKLNDKKYIEIAKNIDFTLMIISGQ